MNSAGRMGYEGERGMKYRLMVAENSHYMDQSEEYPGGEFETMEDASASLLIRRKGHGGHFGGDVAKNSRR